MKLKEFKVKSKLLQHFVEKYVRTMEKRGYVLDVIIDSNVIPSMVELYGVDEQVLIYDVKSEQRLMSVWHGVDGKHRKFDHLESCYMMNGEIASDLRLDNPKVFMTTWNNTKGEVDDWIKKVIRKQTKIKEE